MTAPFLLLDDARSTGAAAARFYSAPSEIICARRPEQIGAALARMEALAAQGAMLAGMIGYEAGLALEPRLAPSLASRWGADGPLLWFGVFDGWEEIAADAVPHWLSQRCAGQAGRLSPMQPTMTLTAYLRRFAAVRDAIAAGDLYQANLTMALTGRWQGDPLALYRTIRGDAAAGYGGVLFDGSEWLLSFSPELFFSIKGKEIRVKPMKGTQVRLADPVADAKGVADLQADIKNRAENLMIVDLMRNDLSRISEAGSVRPDALFAIESYPTIHQMTSSLRAVLAQDCGMMDAIRALFPCGSITGAPKISAMELINRLEPMPRGAYCGAIGRIDSKQGVSEGSGGDAAFNVAIRTLRLTSDGMVSGGQAGGRATLGLGSAIVADSVAMAEWRECLAKGGFVGKSAASCDLIETMAFDPLEGIALLEGHLARLKNSAAELGFACDRHALRNAIQALCFDLDMPAKLRLLLAKSGHHAIEVSPMPAPASGPAAVAICALPLQSDDWRLRHKTSDRAFYDDARAIAKRHGADEMLFMDDDGRLTEGSFTNLFVTRDDGMMITPPLSRGLLPGVLRQQLIAEGRAVEGDLGVNDLIDGFHIGNALRGLMPARLIAAG